MHLENDAARGPGCRPRTSSSSCCAGSRRAAARTRSSSSPGPGTARPVGARARHDREHDRRAGRDVGGLPARRQDARVAARASSARTTSRTSAPDDGAEYDERVEIDLAELGPLVAKPLEPRQRGAGRGGRRDAESRRSAWARRSTRPTCDLALPGAVLADKDGQIVHERVTATATPGLAPDPRRRSPSRASTASSCEGGVRMLEPVCGPCVGMGQAPPSDAELAAHVQPQLPGPLGHARGLGVPLLAGGGRGVAAARRDHATRASTATRPSCSRCPSSSPTSTTCTSSPRPPEDEAETIEIPRGPNIKTPARARAAGRVDRGEDRDRPAGQHLHRRPGARRRRSSCPTARTSRRSPSSPSSTATPSSASG